MRDSEVFMTAANTSHHNLIISFFLEEVLEFEFRALQLLSKCAAPLEPHSRPFCFSFSDRILLLPGTGFRSWSSCLHLPHNLACFFEMMLANFSAYAGLKPQASHLHISCR
jgi:hypothetical protein